MASSRESGNGVRIRPAVDRDFDAILEVINEAARESYRGVIPDDCWSEPYMPAGELREEIEAGVRFRVWDEAGRVVGVMGVQDAGDVVLIRHAYVRPEAQGRGIGGRLLEALLKVGNGPFLVGTWADAADAIRFYRLHGFLPVEADEKDRLLRTYWSIPERQAEASVVLAGPDHVLRRRRRRRGEVRDDAR